MTLACRHRLRVLGVFTYLPAAIIGSKSGCQKWRLKQLPDSLNTPDVHERKKVRQD